MAARNSFVTLLYYGRRMRTGAGAVFSINGNWMKRTLLLLFSVLALAIAASAQKKDIAQARDWVKQSKNLDKAEQTMMKVLKDSANREKEKLWEILFDALRGQYEQGNEKLYLKQKYDTASIFNIASRLFIAMESYDSIDAMPDKKGRVKLKMRKQNSSMLNTLRPNLYNGGVFFIRKKDYKTAYKFFDQYIDAANQPLFKAYKYMEKDKRIPEAAYWAVYCGYKLNDPHKVLHHTYLAMKDTAHNEPMLQYLAATYQLEKDTARFASTLLEGFSRYPLSPFFFPHLIDYYSSHGDWEKALDLTDKALKADSVNKVFLLTKSSILLNTGDYIGSFAICDSLIKREAADSLVAPDVFLNAGLAKFNQGVMLDKNIQVSKRDRDKILQLYKEALPYLEQYRKVRPEATDKWALPLYTIYLNLNMGKKFDEVDKIMKAKQKQ